MSRATRDTDPLTLHEVRLVEAEERLAGGPRHGRHCGCFSPEYLNEPRLPQGVAAAIVITPDRAAMMLNPSSSAEDVSKAWAMLMDKAREVHRLRGH